MKLLDSLKRFFSSGDSSKALFDIDANTTVDSTKTNSSGTGQTGKIKSRGTVEINNSTNYTFVLKIPQDGKIPDDVKQFLKQQFSEGKVQFISESSDQEIENYKKLEEHSDKNHVIEFFQDIISPEDLYYLKTGLYVRELSKTDIDRATKTRDHAAIRGKRARNIIDIAAAGYFESYFMPFFQIKPEEAFQEYEEIVESLPEYIIVHDDMSNQDVVSCFVDKITQKEKYHLQIESISIIGLNSNVDTIINSHSLLKEKYPDLEMLLSTAENDKFKQAKLIIVLNS